MQRNISQPVLSRLLKPTPSAAADPGGAPDRPGKAKQHRGLATGTTEGAPTEKLTPDIAVLLQIEVRIWPLRCGFQVSCMKLILQTQGIE